MGWAAFFSVVALGAALLVVPGSLILRVSGFGWIRSLVFSGPVGLGAIGVAATASGLLGLPWTWAQPGVLIVVLGVAAFLLRHRDRNVPELPIQWKPIVLGAVGVVAFAFLFLRAFTDVVESPEVFPHFGDAAFHLQAAQLVDATRNVNPVGGLGALYDAVNPPRVYYPSLWHACVALLVPVAGLVPATNAMMLVTAVVVWPMGLAALVWVLRPRAVLAPLAVNLLASFVVIFPMVLDAAFSMYPFAMSIVVFPGALGLLLMARSEDRVPALVGLTLAWIGMALAQPSTAVLFVLAPAAMGLLWLFRSWWRWSKSGRWGQVVVTVTVVVIVIGSVFAVLPRVGYVQNLATFSRPSLGYRRAASELVNGVAAVAWPWQPWTYIVVLAVAGAILSLWSTRGRVLVVTAALLAVVYFAAAGPENVLRSLTGPFYKDYQRLAVPVIMMTVVFAAAAIGAAVQWIIEVAPARLRPLLLVVGAVGMIGGAAVLYRSDQGTLAKLNRDYLSLGYVLSDEATPRVDADELSLLQSLDDLGFPSGSRVIGLPSSGVPFTSVVSDLASFVPVSWPYSEDQAYVTRNFSSITSDPKVCRILNDYDVVAFLEVPSLPGGEEREDREYPGLVDVDTSEGFELLGERSGARLWRITACD